MFKRLLKRIQSRIAWNKTRRLQEARAKSYAVNLVITGALRRTA
jgi:hypothetical protein